LKCIGEDRGYRATIEREVTGGKIDVALEKASSTGSPQDGTLIACEISVTTSPEQEIGNLRKCLDAGASRVLLVSPHLKTLKKVRERAQIELKDGLHRLAFLTPEEFVSFLDKQSHDEDRIEAPDGTPTPVGDYQASTVRGWKVRTAVHAAPASEQSSRRQSITEVIMGALKRLGSAGRNR
jgi:hypothetical protein